MAVDPTLLALATELSSANTSLSLDMAEGSAFRSTFLDPLLIRAGETLLGGDIETLLVERVKEQVPEADVSSFSAHRDLVIRVFSILMEPVLREISSVKLTQSLNNAESMTRAELNALLANYYTQVREGDKTRGTVRIYFPSSRSVTVTPLTQFTTGGGLNFFPLVTQQIGSTQMSFQQEGTLFYFDVLVESEGAGTEYNVAAGDISGVVGLVGASRTSNLAQFTASFADETNAEAVARTRNSITVRNLITSRGAAFVLPEAFPAVSSLQVIGVGDAEMDRDVVSGSPSGLIDVSGVPGGLTGKQDPDLVSGQHIHIGGKTDIYVRQAVPDESDLDIENVTDVGVQLYAGSHGFTVAGGATSTFQDEFGFFTKRGVVAGDVLRVGSSEYVIATVTSDTSLDIAPSTLSGGLFSQVYEISRKTTGLVTVPLYDLVAEDSTGAPVLDSVGAPAAPLPGSDTNAQITSGGAAVAKVTNVSAVNIELPLIRAVSVEFLDPLTLLPQGQTVPMKDLLLARAVDALVVPQAGTLATGKVRHYFRDAVNAWVDRSVTRYTVGSYTYQPVLQVSETGIARVDSLLGSDVILDNTGSATNGDYTSVIAVGDRIEVSGKPMAVSALSYSSLNQETTVTVRDALATLFGATFAGADVTSHAGILEANMSFDTATGMYYVDFDVESLVAGGGQVAGTDMDTASDVYSEGWSLRSTIESNAFSTRDKPYLVLTEWVNDTTKLFITLTAPAVRVSYEYASSLVDIQAFVGNADNRIVGEDVLVRHFTPSYVQGSWSFTGVSATDAKDAIVSHINGVDPSSDLESSDIINLLGDLGATHVLLPVTLTQIVQGRSREWAGSFSEDKLAASRTQHFVADDLRISTSVLP